MGNLKRIHVNQHEIRRGGKFPLRLKTSKENIEAKEIAIMHAGVEVARVVYRPEHPLSCGARVWIETRSETEVFA